MDSSSVHYSRMKMMKHKEMPGSILSIKSNKNEKLWNSSKSRIQMLLKTKIVRMKGKTNLKTFWVNKSKRKKQTL
jgi:hypothetical protein